MGTEWGEGWMEGGLADQLADSVADYTIGTGTPRHLQMAQCSACQLRQCSVHLIGLLIRSQGQTEGPRVLLKGPAGVVSSLSQ